MYEVYLWRSALYFTNLWERELCRVRAVLDAIQISELNSHFCSFFFYCALFLYSLLQRFAISHSTVSNESDVINLKLRLENSSWRVSD